MKFVTEERDCKELPRAFLLDVILEPLARLSTSCLDFRSSKNPVTTTVTEAKCYRED